MALKQVEIHKADWPNFEARFPPLPIRVRLLDTVVKNFPRRIFKLFKLQRQEKICSHFLVFVHDLNVTNQPRLPTGIRIARVDHAVVKDIASHNEAFDYSIYRKRLESDELCYCLSIDGKPACYNWVSLSECSIYTGFESKICFKKLGGNEAYTYDLYTFSEYRNRGLGRLLKQFLFYELANLNIKRVYAGIHHENLVSMKIHLTTGFSLYGYCYNYRLMLWVLSFWASNREIKKISNWLEELKAAGFLEQTINIVK